MTDTLLIELLTEELPPKSLRMLGECFAAEIYDRLRSKHFLTDNEGADNGSKKIAFATPRRLAVSISHVHGVLPEREFERRGPAEKSALDTNGNPTQALLGFSRSCGVAPKLSYISRTGTSCSARKKGERIAR
ncbi:MAG: glycine--tRNA ligase subunit beta [Burkholderiales bacterium]